MSRFTNKITLTTLGYIIVGVIVAFLFFGVYTFFEVESFSQQIAYDNSLQEAKRYAETLKSFRSLYTSEVVAEVLDKKQMKITHDYKDVKYDSTGAIPLPATLSMMLAEKMTTENTKVKLYSKYPFPWRKDREMTDFESRAFDHFEKNQLSDEPFYEIDNENKIIRYAIPDKMVTMSCVNCHNNHPQSPKVGWKLGDVRGAISIVKPVNSDQITQATSKTLYLMVFIGAMVLISLGIIISRIQSVRKSIKETRAKIEHLKIGDLPENTLEVPDNEMKEIAEGFNIVNHNLKNIAKFAQSVGAGELTTSFKKLSDKDSIGIALIDMRDNLKRMTEEESKRNWITQGLAQLGEVLRINQHETVLLYDNVIRFIVNYTGSNQAGLFVINETDENNKYLEMLACYAYDRKKYLERKIQIGEGLVGQCFLEGELTYLKDIPDSYSKITSGLGGATPRSLLMIPMRVNDVVYGVIEVLSFHEYTQHELDFMKKAAENIGSIISVAKINERTRLLLQESQQHAENIRSQEEELRQNMEELLATQEEMKRKERHYVEEIERLKKVQIQ